MSSVLVRLEGQGLEQAPLLVEALVEERVEVSERPSPELFRCRGHHPAVGCGLLNHAACRGHERDR
jgi:hypothetical protein